MSNIIGHIIGIDEINKRILIKQLPRNIKVIDLDNIQQQVHNHKDIQKQKLLWSQISQNIIILKKQNALIGSKNVKTKNIENEIKQLMSERNIIRQTMHNIWKDNMSNIIYQQLDKYDKYHVLFIGINIHPKDFRVKVNIPIPVLQTKEYFNKIIFDVSPTTFASNQIRFYLDNYSDLIIRGKFSLDFLKLDYLVNRYEKFSLFYSKLDYTHVPNDELLIVVKKLDKQLLRIEKIPHHIYVATLYKSGDIIPVNTKTPIQGFLTKEAAIENIKSQVNANKPIYIYEVKAEQFHMLDGKLVATQVLNPINEESMLLTI